MRTNRIARRTVSFALSPADIGIEPGDALRLALPDMASPDGTFIVERIEEGAVRRVEARHHAPLAPVSFAGDPKRRNGGGTVSDAFAPVLHFLDLPRFSTGDASSFARIAGFCRPWRRIAISSSAGLEGYRARAVLNRPARLGVLAEPLTAGMTGRFDRSGAIELELFFGGLSSADPLAVLNGENRIAVQAANGAWEVIAFADAVEISPNRWRLIGLLRGLAGTEDAMLAGAATGASVVVLDEAVVPLGITAEERGLAMNWLVESLGSAGGRVGPFAFSGGMRAETPLAPVHLRGERQVSGDIRLAWTRRGRIEADGWDGADIPLDEPEERYRIEIMDGSIIRRTVEVTVPSFLYPAADELVDFGAPQPSLVFRIRQMGRAVPLGITNEATITF